MKVAVISPTPLLGTYATQGDAYHLILCDHVFLDPRYMEFYKQRSKAGDYIILDNSAHETGYGRRAEALISAAECTQASEVVLPDRLFFGDDTVDASCEAARVLRRKFGGEIALMGVPQGRTEEEWYFCCRDLLVKAGVDTIGISKDYEVWPGSLMRRVEVVRHLCRHLNLKVSIHLLGWGRLLTVLHRLAEIEEDVYAPLRGVDSAKPLVYATSGILLPYDLTQCPPYPKRSDDFFAQESIPHATACNNIDVFRFHAGSTVRELPVT